MNHLIEEILIEEHRRDIQREISHIHLEGWALQGKVFRPNLFTRAMQKLGQWLITRGERLVKHYEAPVHCTASSEHRYAH